MRRSLATRLFTAALVLPLFAACSDDKNGNTMTGPDGTTVRVYSQVERLGNPLVSEVFFAKRDHGLHNTTAPSTDIANGFRTKIKAFTDAFNRGNTIGTTLGAVLVPSQAMERRSVTVVFPIEKQSSADRKASQAEFTTSLGQELRDRLGVRTGIKDRRNKDKIDQVENQLALGATLTHPYVVCSTTVPKVAPINEFGRRLDAAIRQAGFAPQRLDMSQDCAFVTANIPLGISLARKGLL